MAAVSTIPSEYLEDVSDERSLGAVSSLSSEDDVTTVEHNSLDWYAVVQRSAKQRLQDLHKNKASAPAAQNAALRREAATPTIVTVVRPSKETGAAKSEWTTGAATTLDVALGPGRLGASWRRTFPVAFGVGVGGGSGPDAGKLDAASSSGCEALVAPLVAALCPGLSGALDGSLPRGAATTVLAVGSAAACEECVFGAAHDDAGFGGVAARVIEDAGSRLGGRRAGLERGDASQTGGHPLVLGVVAVDAAGDVLDLLPPSDHADARGVGGGSRAMGRKRVRRLLNAARANLLHLGLKEPAHVVATIDVKSDVRSLAAPGSTAARRVHVVHVAAPPRKRFEETEATGGAQLASLAAALRHAFGLDADDAPPREDALARLLHGTSVAPDAAPVVATCVGLGPRELDAALPCLEWGALSSRDDAARRRALSARAVAAACDEAAADAAALAAVVAELRPPSVAEIEARDRQPRKKAPEQASPPRSPPTSPPRVAAPIRPDPDVAAVDALVAREREAAAASLERAIEETRAQRDAERALRDLREALHDAERERDAAVADAKQEADARRAEAEARFAAEAAELESSAAARTLEARFEALELQLEGAANVAIEAASQAAAATDARDAEAAAALAALNLAALQQQQLVVVPEPPASPTRSVSTAAQYSPPGPPAVKRASPRSAPPSSPGASSVKSGLFDDKGSLDSELVHTSLHSLERRAQLLEQELERSRAEAARQAVELRRREELAGRERDRAEQAVLREKAAAEARVEELRRAASRELEDSLRDVHGAVAKQADAARAALRDLADERDAAVEDKAKLVAAAKAERDALERELRDARAAADRERAVADATRADAAAVAYGERLRASAEAERRRAEATAAAAAVDVAPAAPAPEAPPAPPADLDAPPPPPFGDDVFGRSAPPSPARREVLALESALVSREREISELRASSRREAAALWLAVGKAEDALAATTRVAGAATAPPPRANWDSDGSNYSLLSDGRRPARSPPRRRSAGGRRRADRDDLDDTDDDSALDSVVSELDDLDARLARLRRGRGAPAPRGRPGLEPVASDDDGAGLDELDAPPPPPPPRRVEDARPPPPRRGAPAAPPPRRKDPVPRVERTNRDVLEFLELSSDARGRRSAPPPPPPPQRTSSPRRLSPTRVLDDAAPDPRPGGSRSSRGPPSSRASPSASSAVQSATRESRAARRERILAERKAKRRGTFNAAHYPGTLRSSASITSSR